MNIWYDVSGLYNWSGNFTGIQRAVFNIGKSLSIEDPSARFFIFQHAVNDIFLVELSRLYFESPALIKV